jgi:hypothetical protein
MTDQQRIRYDRCSRQLAHLHAEHGSAGAKGNQFFERIRDLPSLRCRALHNPHRMRAGDDPSVQQCEGKCCGGQAVEMEARCGPTWAERCRASAIELLESASSIRIRGTKTSVSKQCGAAKKLTIHQIAKAMTTVRGWRGSILSSISSSNPWANGLRCFTFRNAARFQPI